MATGGDLELQKIGQPGSLNICQAYEYIKGALNDVRGLESAWWLVPPIWKGDGNRTIHWTVLKRCSDFGIIRMGVQCAKPVQRGIQPRLCWWWDEHPRIYIPATTATVASITIRSKLWKIRKEWPGCQKIIQDAIKWRGASTRRPLQVEGFNLVVPTRLLEEHMDHILRVCTPSSGWRDKWNVQFSTCYDKKSKSHRLSKFIRLLGISYSFSLSSGENGQVSFQPVETINDVHCLYYGARLFFTWNTILKPWMRGLCETSQPKRNSRMEWATHTLPEI